MSSTFDFDSIRPVGGSVQDGFEELCCQISRLYDEVPEDSRFTKKGFRDSGIECLWELPNGETWGWQAKFFDQIDSSQLDQLDDSVEAALDNHPNLSKYFICVPYDPEDPDLDDGRRKTELEKLNYRIEKWEDWAEDRDMEVEFVYWGESKLTGLLDQEKFRGRLYFWFEKEQLTDNKLEQQTGVQIKNAKPRYTPEADVDVPIAKAFEALGRTNWFHNEFQRNLSNLQEKEHKALSDGRPELLRNLHSSEYQDLVESLEIIPQLASNLNKIHEPFPLGEIISETNTAVSAVSTLQDEIREEQDDESQDKELKTANRHLRELWSELRNFRSVLQQDSTSLINNSVLCITGGAGVGKTHLFCDIAENRLSEGKPTVLVLANSYQGGNPWKFVIEETELECGVDEFLEALDAFGEARDVRSLILIDGLNESRAMDQWLDYLSGMIQKLSHYPYVGLAFSLRPEYERWIIPEHLSDDDLVKIEHRGFVDREYEATQTFFDYYGLEEPSVPLLSPEFQNPLFLKLFCESLEERDEPRVPSGSQNLSNIFNNYLGSIHREISRPSELGYNPDRNLVKEGVEALAREMAEQETDWLSKDETIAILEGLYESDSYDDSLYHRMESENAISEFVNIREDQKAVRFPYQKFSDHFIAKEYLDLYLDTDDVDVSFQDGSELSRIISNGRNPGLIQALSIQLPEYVDRELFEFFPGENLVEPFIDSITWRKPETLTNQDGEIKEPILDFIHDFVNTRRRVTNFLDTVLTVALKPDHPFNAKYLHENLLNREIQDRDHLWTLYLNRRWDPENTTQLVRIVEWAGELEDEEPGDEVKVLSSIILSWLFTSSNRFVRDRATKALTNLLDDDFEIWKKVVNQFQGANDPYVLERVYASAYGACLRNPSDSEMPLLAEAVYQREFKDCSPLPHFLARDYARGIIKASLRADTDFQVNQELVDPPYESPEPEIPSAKELKQQWESVVEATEHDWESLDSEWFDLIGGDYEGDGFSDFARYIVGSNNDRYFKNHNLEIGEALRWIVKRIIELGWHPDLFKEFDDRLRKRPYDRHDTAKPERIGKKYQWIAYHELQSRVFDNYQPITGTTSEITEYPQPWDWHISDRDIDPSFSLAHYTKPETDWWNPITEEEATNPEQSHKDWVTSTETPDLEQLIQFDHGDETWINLHGRYSYREEKKGLICHFHSSLAKTHTSVA